MREGMGFRDHASRELAMSMDRSEVRLHLRVALLDALVVNPLQELTERDVAKRAAVSPARFSEYYRDLDECVYDTLDWVGEDIYVLFARTFEGPGDVHTRLVDAIEQALGWLLANPGAMRLWFLEARRTHDLALQARQAKARDRLVQLITRPEEGWIADVPDLHVEFLFGALVHAAHDELAAGGDCAKAGRKIRGLLALFEPAAA